MTEFETRTTAPPPDAGVAADNDNGVAPTGVLIELSGAFSAARAALANFLDLMSLEARRAGLVLTWMLMCGVVAGVLIITAWLGLMLALMMAFISIGVPAAAGVIVIALINGAAGVMLIRKCIGMSQALLFSATRRQVAGHHSDQAAES